MDDETDQWRSDGRLAHQLAHLNQLLGRYVLRISDSMQGHEDEELTPQDERDLGAAVREIGDRIQRRAERREPTSTACAAPQIVEGAVASLTRPPPTPGQKPMHAIRPSGAPQRLGEDVG